MHRSYLILLLACTGTFAMQCSQNPATHVFSFGKVQGTVISDGPIILEDNFFNVPDSTVRRAYRDCFRSAKPVIWQQNVFVLDTKVGRILVDVGAFNTPRIFRFRKGGQLLPNLIGAGIDPKSIDFVLLTHGHRDHVAGLTDIEGRAAYPNAEVYVGKTEHEFWTTEPIPNPNPDIPNSTMALFGDIYRRNIAPYKVNLVRDNTSPLRGIRFVPTPGHTPGHMAIEFVSAGERLVVIGDTWFTKPDQVRNPEWILVFDVNGLDALKSRKSMLKSVSKRRHLVLAYHEEFPGLGHVSRSQRSYDWVPASVQFLGTAVKTVC